LAAALCFGPAPESLHPPPCPSRCPTGLERTPPRKPKRPSSTGGFYRFKVGDFGATVISDGYGNIPLRPILAPNASEADFKELLKANFISPTVQGTSNILVVDTGRERILVDSG
jgi:hypothetical protein